MIKPIIVETSNSYYGLSKPDEMFMFVKLGAKRQTLGYAIGLFDQPYKPPEVFSTFPPVAIPPIADDDIKKLIKDKYYDLEFADFTIDGQHRLKLIGINDRTVLVSP